MKPKPLSDELSSPPKRTADKKRFATTGERETIARKAAAARWKAKKAANKS